VARAARSASSGAAPRIPCRAARACASARVAARRLPRGSRRAGTATGSRGAGSLSAVVQWCPSIPPMHDLAPCDSCVWLVLALSGVKPSRSLARPLRGDEARERRHSRKGTYSGVQGTTQPFLPKIKKARGCASGRANTTRSEERLSANGPKTLISLRNLSEILVWGSAGSRSPHRWLSPSCLPRAARGPCGRTPRPASARPAWRTDRPRTAQSSRPRRAAWCRRARASPPSRRPSAPASRCRR
jgi:hypothetical protein